MQKIVEGITFDVRPLTRGEIKALRKRGYNMVNISPENADDAIDAVLEIVIGARVEDIDKLPNSGALDLFKTIIEETYGTGEASKNS